MDPRNQEVDGSRISTGRGTFEGGTCVGTVAMRPLAKFTLDTC